MRPQPSIKTFALELALYALLVICYFFVVLHVFGGWFKELYDHDRLLFAVVALAVMVGQAVGLELVNGAIWWVVRRGEK